MKRIHLMAGFVMAALAVCLASYCFPNSAGAPAGRYATCGFERCHIRGGQNPFGSMSVKVYDKKNQPITSYLADSIYMIRIDVRDPDAKKFGFEVAAISGGISGISAGRFILTDTKRMQFADMDTNYVTHTFEGNIPVSPGKGSWAFLWKAPGKPVGEVTFYAACNGANGDGTNAGDHIYTGSQSVLPFGADIKTVAHVFRSLNIFPNPVSDFITMNYDIDLPLETTVNILDAYGENVFAQKHYGVQGLNCNTIAVNGLKSGVYFLKISGQYGYTVQKFIKL